MILIGLDDAELMENKPIVTDLVIPRAPNRIAPVEPPGAVHIITKKPDCNAPGASFGVACESQAREFADFARRALRSNVATLDLTVRTVDDTDPNTPAITGAPLSLRNAIEMANSNCGKTTITFDSALGGKKIRPSAPLPPLAAPDITICGCGAGCSSSMPGQSACSLAPAGETAACEPVIIDGQNKLADGILIRSNRGIVRGLRIIDFTHAGIVVQPVSPCDNTGFNRIELNILENNVMAGVCVLDPPDLPLAVAHNIGNTISQNCISGSVTPIDLGGDGPTGNDACDTDPGPNTLLNFPRITAVTQSTGSVTVAGTICDPSCESQVCPSPELIGAVVEIFGVTGFGPGSTGDLATGLSGV